MQPQSKEAEKSLLATLILDPSMYHIVSGLVTDDSFYTTKHQEVFFAITKLVKEDIPIDLVSLSDELNGKVSRSELVDIANSQVSGANAEYHAVIVAKNHAKRKLRRALQEGIYKIENGGELFDIITDVQKNMTVDIKQKDIKSDIYPEVLDVVEELIDIPPGGLDNYIKTGFPKLDYQTKLMKGTLTVFASDPGVGKTSFMLDVARNMSRNGKRALMFTLEMTRKQIIQNIIAQEFGLCHQDMISGRLSNENITTLSHGINRFGEMNIGVIEGRWTISAIRHRLVTEINEKGVDCLMIDSLGNISPPEGLDVINQTAEAYNWYTSELVKIAVEFDLPVLLSHHLNKSEGRRGKNNRPTRGSLNQAGDKWAHNVILGYREYLETHEDDVKNDADFIIVKARDGIVGTVKMGFTGPCKSFYNMDTHREPPQVMAGGKQWGN